MSGVPGSVTPPTTPTIWSTEQEALLTHLPAKTKASILLALQENSSALNGATTEAALKNIMAKILKQLHLYSGAADNTLLDSVVHMWVTNLKVDKAKASTIEQDIVDSTTDYSKSGDYTPPPVGSPYIPPPVLKILNTFWGLAVNERGKLQGEGFSHFLDSALDAVKTSSHVPHPNKEVQLWMTNLVAVQLFIVMNEIVTDLAKMRMDWNKKMIEIKKVMLDMAKDMYNLSIEAADARFKAAWVEIGSLIAEGSLGLVNFTTQILLHFQQDFRQQKIGETAQDLENKIEKLRGRGVDTTLEYKSAKAEIEPLTNKIDQAKTEIKKQQEIITQQTARKAAATLAPDIADASDQIKRAEGEIKNQHTKIKEANQAIEQKVAEFGANKKQLGQQLVSLEYRLEHKEDPAFHVISEMAKTTKESELQKNFEERRQLMSILFNAITSVVKAGFQAGKAPLELEASKTDALVKLLSQMYQALQETNSSVIQATQDSISKQIESLLELLKSVQAIQGQR